MKWHKAGRLDTFDSSGRECKTIAGQKILLIKRENKIYAIASQCPHFKLPLKNGKISEDGAIICPFHKSAFDLETGNVKDWSPWPPAVGPLLGKISKQKTLTTYVTKCEGNDILIQI